MIDARPLSSTKAESQMKDQLMAGMERLYIGKVCIRLFKKNQEKYIFD